MSVSEEFVVLSLNSGSSSLKLALYTFRNGTAKKLLWGEAQEVGSRNGRVRSGGDSALSLEEARSFDNSAEAASYFMQKMQEASLPRPRAVGHRIVHGGPLLREHQLITAEVLARLEEAVSFAPVHLPPSLHVLRSAMKLYPDVPHIACFDTAFHRTIPECATHLPFDHEFWTEGLRRYGFHGLSCESILRSLGGELAPRSVIAHLGNGCSITAVRNGDSLETTMGLTPTGGVMMGTRSGDLDPGVLMSLLRKGYSAEQLDSLLNHKSGLLGVSEKSSDMRPLLECRARDGKARLAVEMFCYQIRKSIGAMAAVLDGMDMLVFTGGIGEHAAPIRAQICTGLGHLGVVLEEVANQQSAERISAAGAKCDVRVIATDEDREIAQHSYTLAIASAPGKGTKSAPVR